MSSPAPPDRNPIVRNELLTTSAAILAGGLGTRLRTVVAHRPKVLAEVRGRPFLNYLMDQLAAVGIGHVVLCTGYMGDQVQSTFGDSYGSIRLSYSHEDSPLGTGGALRRACSLFESEPVLVLNGDSFFDVDLVELWKFHRMAGAEGTLALVETKDTRRYGRVSIQEDGIVTGFSEKADTVGPGWVNAGVYLFSRSLLASIHENCPVSLEREVLPAWVGCGLFGYRSEGAFLDIGTPESYATTEQFFESERFGR